MCRAQRSNSDGPGMLLPTSEVEMIRLPINGLSNGDHPIAITVAVEQVEGIFPEFVGTVQISGMLSKVGKKIVLELVASGTARLTCDYSLEVFDEHIEATFSLAYLQDTELYLRQPNQQQRIEDDPYALRLLREDDTFVDITTDVAEELSVRLPIKRVAPQFRHMTFAEYARTVLGDRVHVAASNALRTDSPWSSLEQLNGENRT
ncbi:MAG: hypothetical protein KatS3mg040_1010 [Candidatus Kapaibacterium sp.]|nr:MAG: hypothetical protein KatS3mg040_1010 [Candidatus Kapabacteria bacterium]